MPSYPSLKGKPDTDLSESQPTILTSRAAISHALQKAEQVILFGDVHNQSTGHQTLAAMMGDLRKAHVKYLAMELSFPFNEDLAYLQQEIAAKHLAPKAVSLCLRGIINKAGGRLNFDNAYDDFAGVVLEATKNGIAVVGIDHRNEDTQASLEKVQAQGGNPQIAVQKVEMSADDIAASDVMRLAGDLKKGERVAVMYGVMHTATQSPSGTTLAEHLSESGTPVTTIMLGTQADLSKQYTDAGADFTKIGTPPLIQIDTSAYLKDESHSKIRLHQHKSHHRTGL